MSEYQAYKVKVDGLKMRALPSIRGSVIDWLSVGDIVLLDTDSQTEDDGIIWMEHSRGWSGVKSKNGSWVYMEPVPQAEPEPAPEPEPETPDEIIVGPDVVVLPEPGDDVSVAGFTQAQMITINGLILTAIDEKLQGHIRDRHSGADSTVPDERLLELLDDFRSHAKIIADTLYEIRHYLSEPMGQAIDMPQEIFESITAPGMARGKEI